MLRHCWRPVCCVRERHLVAVVSFLLLMMTLMAREMQKKSTLHTRLVYFVNTKCMTGFLVAGSLVCESIAFTVTVYTILNVAGCFFCYVPGAHTHTHASRAHTWDTHKPTIFKQRILNEKNKMRFNLFIINRQ